MMKQIATCLLTLWMLLAGSYAPAIAGSYDASAHRNTVASVDEYRLDAGDKIKVHVFGEQDLDVEVRLGSSGDIRYPLLGKIHASGMTMPELEQKVARELANGFLRDPQVRVSMEEFRPFYVNGEVKSPGAYPYQPGLTIRKAISLVGGLTPEADVNKVFLIRAKDDMRSEKRVKMNTPLSPGDMVIVKQSYFFVNGAVNSPGKYPYQPNMTYRMALTLTGGVTERGNEDNIRVIHEGLKSESQRLRSLDDLLQPGDVMTVKESFF